MVRQRSRAWDTSTGEEIYRIGHELDVNDVSFSPDGEYLVTASWDDTAKIVDRSGRVIRVLREDGFDLDHGPVQPRWAPRCYGGLLEGSADAPT